MVENKNRFEQSEDRDEASARRLRLIRAGLRNQDEETLNVVQAEYEEMFGETMGRKVFIESRDIIMMEINEADMVRKYPELEGKI